MTTKQITITRALKELKTLGDRINKMTNEATFCFLQEKPGQLSIGFSSIEELEKSLKANYQSLVDLIAYRERIKQAIVNSNATTIVTVAGKQMTVAAAIETKQSSVYKLALGRAMKSQLEKAENVKTRLDNQTSSRLDDLIKSTFQGRAISELEYASVANPFIEGNKVNIVDPLYLSKKINSLHDEVAEFLNNVDDVLTVSNSTNYIEV
jgi:hypothetical protein